MNTSQAEKQIRVKPGQLCAPFDGMDKPWPEAKKAEFAAALNLYPSDKEPSVNDNTSLGEAGELGRSFEHAVRACATCDGHGEIGGFVNAESGYASEPCPACSAPKLTEGYSQTQGTKYSDEEIAQAIERFEEVCSGYKKELAGLHLKEKIQELELEIESLKAKELAIFNETKAAALLAITDSKNHQNLQTIIKAVQALDFSALPMNTVAAPAV